MLCSIYYQQQIYIPLFSNGIGDNSSRHIFSKIFDEENKENIACQYIVYSQNEIMSKIYVKRSDKNKNVEIFSKENNYFIGSINKNHTLFIPGDFVIKLNPKWKNIKKEEIQYVFLKGLDALNYSCIVSTTKNQKIFENIQKDIINYFNTN